MAASDRTPPGLPGERFAPPDPAGGTGYRGPEGRGPDGARDGDSVAAPPPVAPPPADKRAFLDALRASMDHPVRPAPGAGVRVGLDLGTSSIVLVVLAADGTPLGLAREEADVVRDGLVVEFAEAASIAARLRERLEAALGATLGAASIAVPPGTGRRDAGTHRHVCEAAGLEVDRIWEEPEAANLLLGLADGAIADLGGGTTGAAVVEGGRVVRSFDEPTGGHHLSLVLAGRFGIPLEEAERLKLDPSRRGEVAPLVAPVLAKMGRILKTGLEGRPVPILCLVGGSAAAPGAGAVIAAETGLEVQVLHEPELITPAGIALGCRARTPGPRVS